MAVRGETEWARNLRAAREGELVLGGKAEPFAAEELADPDNTEILRAYLKRWVAEVAGFFDGARVKSPAEELRRVAPAPGVQVRHAALSRPSPAATRRLRKAHAARCG